MQNIYGFILYAEIRKRDEEKKTLGHVWQFSDKGNPYLLTYGKCPAEVLKRFLYFGAYADKRISGGNTMGIKLIRSTAPHFHRLW
jgi:hypothetical protein